MTGGRQSVFTEFRVLTNNLSLEDACPFAGLDGPVPSGVCGDRLDISPLAVIVLTEWIIIYICELNYVRSIQISSGQKDLLH